MKRLVLLLGLAGLLTACGGGTKSTSPQALPPIKAGGSSTAPTSTASGPASPGPLTVPSDPASASGQQETQDPGEVQAAADFARSWLASIDRAYEELSYRDLQAVSDPACQTCNNLIASVKDVVARQHQYRSGRTSILDVAAPPVEDGRTSVTAVVSYPAATEVDAKGAVVRRLPGKAKVALQIQLRRTGSGWIVTEMYSL